MYHLLGVQFFYPSLGDRDNSPSIDLIHSHLQVRISLCFGFLLASLVQALGSASQPCSHSWPLAGQVIRVHLGIDNVSQAGNKSQPIQLDVFPGRSGFSGGSSMWVPSAGELLQGQPFLACFFLEVMHSFPFSAIERGGSVLLGI